MKRCIFFVFFISRFLIGQSQKPNWHAKDLGVDSVFGISLTKAYTELLKGKISKLVIVGIIDSGVDTSHEDLKNILWTNPENGAHGWNYIGSETGREDITQLVGNKKDLYDSLSFMTVPESYRVGYQAYRKHVPQLNSKITAMRELVSELENDLKIVDLIVGKIGAVNPGVEEFKEYKDSDETEEKLIKRVIKRLPLYANWSTYRQAEIVNIITLAKYHLDHGLNINNAERDTALGTSDISPDKLGPVFDPNFQGYHGTHVAGIIGAIRDNGIGSEGIADHVQVMMLKTNGTLRELRDKSLAKAIYFAVDHGARVINMSFGKPYTWDKNSVDEAVKYAMKKDVLLVHAAGNDGDNLDKEEHYPNPVYTDKSGKANAWIEVGASGWKDDSTLIASFSNYGKISVDVFAPGEEIYSTLPYNQYNSWSGTSMAAPVVAGLAALIREYYPNLKAYQVKEIIMQSVVKRQILSDKCVSGGVVNAYNALQLAANMK